jgi:polyhydroxyalkanoate synthesis regulator phasin
MASKGRAHEELKEAARKAAREKIMREIEAPLSELAAKRAELKRLREKVCELKEVANELSGNADAE